EKLKLYGFLPYTYTAPSIDYLTQKLGSIQYVIGEDSVSGTHGVVPLSQGELDSLKAVLVTQCSNDLTELLYNTDWIYLADAGLDSNQETAYAELRAQIVQA